MITIVMVLSFLLEILFSNIVSLSSIFIPLFLIVSLVLMYPYFNSKLYYIIVCAICGLIYDLGFLNTVFINTLCFTFVALMIMFLHFYMNYKFVSTNIVNIIIIIFYRIISYIIVCLVGYANFHFNILFKGIYSSLVINIIYAIILYLALELMCNRFNIKKNE